MLSKDSGLTLIEVVLAMFILSITILGSQLLINVVGSQLLTPEKNLEAINATRYIAKKIQSIQMQDCQKAQTQDKLESIICGEIPQWEGLLSEMLDYPILDHANLWISRETKQNSISEYKIQIVENKSLLFETRIIKQSS